MSDSDRPPPFLTVVVPTLDEERYIERCLTTLLADPYPRDRLEVLVVDGGSTDRTVAIAEGLSSEQMPIRVLDNPRRVQSAAFNIALGEADPRSTAILRCDAHASFPPGFATRAVETLERTGAGLVGFCALPVGERPFQRAVAAAQSSRLGVGGAEYRLGGRSGWVASAMHGCFDRAAVAAVGGYDESFTHNEDAELSLRLRRSGRGVWLDDGLVLNYYPRDSVRGLARQYFRYGVGRARTCVRHRTVPRLRQLAPPLLVLGELAMAAVALTAARPAYLLPLAAYALAVVGAAAWEAVRRRDPASALSAIAFATMHHAWGAGFLLGLAKAALDRRKPDSPEPRR